MHCFIIFCKNRWHFQCGQSQVGPLFTGKTLELIRRYSTSLSSKHELVDDTGSADFGLEIKMIPVLVYIPIQDVVDAFNKLPNSIPHEAHDYHEAHEARQIILDYFEDTWIGRHAKMWTMRGYTIARIQEIWTYVTEGNILLSL